jgi:hypothetical protein
MYLSSEIAQPSTTSRVVLVRLSLMWYESFFASSALSNSAASLFRLVTHDESHSHSPTEPQLCAIQIARWFWKNCLATLTIWLGFNKLLIRILSTKNKNSKSNSSRIEGYLNNLECPIFRHVRPICYQLVISQHTLKSSFLSNPYLRVLLTTIQSDINRWQATRIRRMINKECFCVQRRHVWIGLGFGILK